MFIFSSCFVVAQRRSNQISSHTRYNEKVKDYDISSFIFLFRSFVEKRKSVDEEIYFNCGSSSKRKKKKRTERTNNCLLFFITSSSSSGSSSAFTFRIFFSQLNAKAKEFRQEFSLESLTTRASSARRFFSS